MAPLYEVVMMTKSGKGATVQLTSLLTSCAKSLWAKGAVLADIRPWGVRDLAYRIRKQSQNYYQAQYVSMHVYCSPPTLQQLEGQLRTSPHVLRWMTLRQKSVPPIDKATRFPFRAERPTEPIDLESDPTEAAKWEYRNLVMQRVFEGRTKQELVAEQLSRHRFQTAHRSAAIDEEAARARSGLLVGDVRAASDAKLGAGAAAGGQLETGSSSGEAPDTELLPDAPPPTPRE